MRSRNLVVQPDDGIGPVVEFLRSARTSVAIKQFTFDHPALLDEVFALHDRGVKVRVLLNAAKTTGERINDPFFEKMRAKGIPVEWSNPKFLVTHEKSIVVDEQAALLATFNFMPKYFEKTRDYGIFIHEADKVRQLLECFECDWQRVDFHPHGSSGLGWSPGNARRLMCEVIDGATRSLVVQHPKFAEPVVYARVIAAAMRGVDTRILCGGKHGLHQPDLMFSFALWQSAHDADVKVHKQLNLHTHAKLIISDERIAFLGSQNIDQPAFDHRREVGILIRHEAQVADLFEVFERDWEQSRKYEPPNPMEEPHVDEDGEFGADAHVSHD